MTLEDLRKKVAEDHKRATDEALAPSSGASSLAELKKKVSEEHTSTMSSSLSAQADRDQNSRGIVERMFSEGSAMPGMGALDAAYTMGRGALGMAAGGLAGLGELALSGGDIDSAVDRMGSVQSFVGGSGPATEQGASVLQAVDESVVGDFGRGVEATGDYLGDNVLELTGSPELATLAKTAPDLLMEIVPAAAALKVTRANAKAAKLAKLNKVDNQKARIVDPEAYRSGDLAAVKLDPDGKLVTDKLGEALLDEGVASPLAATVTNANKGTKGVMKDMLRSSINRMNNPSVPGSARYVGKQVTEQLRFLDNKAKSLGAELEGVVKGSVGRQRVDTNDILQSVQGGLQQYGIKPRVRDGQIMGYSFGKDSQFLGKVNTATRNRISATLNEFVDVTGDNPTFSRLHSLKKRLDATAETLMNDKGVSPQARNVVLSMRKALNDRLASIDPKGYGKINAELSTIYKAQEPFQAARKSAGGWDSTNLEGILSAKARRANAANPSAQGVQISSGLDNLKGAVAAFGGKADVDYRALLDFQDYIDEHFIVSDEWLKSQSKIDSTTVQNQLLGIGLSGGLGNTFGAAHGLGGLTGTVRQASKGKQAVKSRQTTRALMLRALEE